jgi:hypothetical protein
VPRESPITYSEGRNPYRTIRTNSNTPWLADYSYGMQQWTTTTTTENIDPLASWALELLNMSINPRIDSYVSTSRVTPENGATTMPTTTTTTENTYLPDTQNIRSNYLPVITPEEATAQLMAWDASRAVSSRLDARYIIVGRAGVYGQSGPFGPLSFAFDDESAVEAGYENFEAWGEAMVTFRSTLLQSTFALDGKITAIVRRAMNKNLPSGFSVSTSENKLRFVTTRKSALAQTFAKRQTIVAKEANGGGWRNRPFTRKAEGTFDPAHILDMIKTAEKFAEKYKAFINAERKRLKQASMDKVSNQPRHIRNAKVRSGGGSEQTFDTFLVTRAARVKKYSREIIDNLPAAAHGTASSRKWGIEVESGGARGVTAPQGWRSVGDGSLNSSYSDYQSGDCQEFVSPILHSFHSAGLEFLTDELSKRPQNNSAGLHVHVEANDLTAPQLGAIVFGYQIIEPIIKAAYSREVWQYCALRPNRSVLSLMKALSKSESIDYGTRYTTLNLCSLEEHGTIEFRAMGPVYEYEYLIRWASFCREMVNTAKNGAKAKDYQSVVDEASLRALFIKFGNETVNSALSLMSDEIRSSLEYDNRNVSREMVTATNGEI